MKSTLVTSILGGLALLLASCANSSTGGTTPTSVKPYKLDTCIVSDNQLGSMGPVVSKVYNGQEVKFCCKACVGKFDANPGKFLGKVR